MNKPATLDTATPASLCDDRGTIEVADTQAEASERVASIRGGLA